MSASEDPRAQLSRSSVARYIQLATLFRRRVESGKWPAGTQLPTIDDLVVEFGVARATIRQALGLLESEGLIARYRAKGTFVTDKVKAHLWLDVTTDLRGMLNSRDGATIEVLEDDIVEPLIGKRIDVPKDLAALLEKPAQAQLIAVDDAVLTRILREG